MKSVNDKIWGRPNPWELVPEQTQNAVKIDLYREIRKKVMAPVEDQVRIKIWEFVLEQEYFHR